MRFVRDALGYKKVNFFLGGRGLLERLAVMLPLISTPIFAYALVTAVDVPAGRATGLRTRSSWPGAKSILRWAQSTRPLGRGASDRYKSVITRTTTADNGRLPRGRVRSTRTCSRVEKPSGLLKYTIQNPAGVEYLYPQSNSTNVPVDPNSSFDSKVSFASA